MSLTIIKINNEIIKKVAQATKLAVEYEELTGRRLGITGEVGEVLVCQKLGLSLIADPLFAGYDAIDKANNEKYQIKTRRVNHLKGRIGSFSKHEFDFAILAILNNDYKICELYKAQSKNLKTIIEKAPKRNPSLRSFINVSEKL